MNSSGPHIPRIAFVNVVILVIAMIATGATISRTSIGTPQEKASTDAAARVVVEHGVRARMRDGISLVADIYRPAKGGKYPVLLERTPYNRKDDAGMAYELASHDYVVVVQDTRGRYDSEGEFYPFLFESQDGYDSVEWAAALPSSTGEVGMFGGSYVGATQMLAAIAKPSHLVAIFPYVTASEYYDGWMYQDGALMQWFAGSWSSILAVDTLRRQADERIRRSSGSSRCPSRSIPS